MQIELVETFLDICETGNFNRSAERLGITQSTVSARVKALEAKLERRLFVRNRSGAALTTEGLRFEPHARGLRHAWSQAVNATRDAGPLAMTLRIGIQHDLAGDRVGEWVSNFRNVSPEVAFYIEADYSEQMSLDIVRGSLDLAIMYTPKIYPDLHVETVGEITYQMISTDIDHLQDITPDRYVLANYSPAFTQYHQALFPGLSDVQLSSGQDAAIVGILNAEGGTAYLMKETAKGLIAGNRCKPVKGARDIVQSVFAGLHLRNRHRPMHQRLVRQLRRHFGT